MRVSFYEYGSFKKINDKEKLVGHFVTAKNGQYSKNMICKIDVKTQIYVDRLESEYKTTKKIISIVSACMSS